MSVVRWAEEDSSRVRVPRGRGGRRHDDARHGHQRRIHGNTQEGCLSYSAFSSNNQLHRGTKVRMRTNNHTPYRETLACIWAPSEILFERLNNVDMLTIFINVL